MPKVFVPRERRPGETRVATIPETVKRLVKNGWTVAIEPGAGARSSFLDPMYTDAGATLEEAWDADVVAKIAPPTVEEVGKIRNGAILVSFVAPHKNLDVVRALRDRKVDTFAMELVPRITRAQGMDALSSQASIAGYKAVLVAATHLGKYLPLLMTAAGTIQPARVVIMGAGVAGLQAIATARRLGAIVEVSDIRPAVKEQVESLGAKFIDLPQMEESGEGKGGYAKEVSKEFLAKQQAVIAAKIAAADIVITTALVPGKPAPRLVTAEMVKSMKPGSVIVDLAVEQGGNCELSQPGEDVVKEGVLIVGHSNLPATVPVHASTLYARNVSAVLQHLAPKGELKLDPKDEINAGSLLVHEGKITHEPTAALVEKEKA
jgi:NAD(P) transhydrogenase subunit alpha